MKRKHILSGLAAIGICFGAVYIESAVNNASTAAHEYATTKQANVDNQQLEINQHKKHYLHISNVLKTHAISQVDTYTVQQGDSLGSIAAKHNIALEDLLKLNGITHDQVIVHGDQIKIKDKGTAKFSAGITKPAQPVKQPVDDAATKVVPTPTNNDVDDVTPTPAPAPDVSNDTPDRTDGMNFNGYHFPITGFSGSGYTPQNTPYIFAWAGLANYYLAEAASDAGRAVRTLGAGSEIVLNGQKLHVASVNSGLERVSSFDYVANQLQHHRIAIQTCDDATGAHITVIFAD
ncbi:MAG: LysM peptidoglycan-binding domain-containing protein [Lactobacillaceae bacterium]|jgi:LysM repeat protein|nr:LysM peptidoglycan-binding domain-containing protein [Lactobacillaceae bacterium]